MASSAHTQGREVFIKWEKPKEPFIKSNVDGAVIRNPDLAGATVVLRDHDGRWLKGATRSLDVCSPFCSELWAGLIGLQLARDSGYRKIIFETNSKAILQLLTNPSNAGGINGGLLDKCNDLISRDCDLQIKHIYRESSKVANMVAKWVLKQPLDLHLLSHPLVEVRA